jgi:hypothetical protein
MTEPNATRAFLLSEIERLEAFDFVAVVPSGMPIHALEVTRLEGGGLEVRVPGRPPFVPALTEPIRKALAEHGFVSEAGEDQTKPWVKSAADAESSADLVMDTLTGVFEQKPDAKLDIAHGSHKAEHEARAKLKIARTRIESVLTEVLGKKPELDEDQDFVLPIDDVHVMVSPRVVMTGQIVVRVFAITNVGVQVTPELGLFLARLNFGLTFGRFALDAEHGSIWFDEAILGEEFREEELRFAVQMVSTTADQWDDRLKQMFGGAKYQEVLSQKRVQPLPISKPGEGVAGQYL